LLYGRKGDYARSLSDFDRALSIDPDDAHAHALRGLVWLRKNDRNKAVADFDKAIALDPTNADSYRAIMERALGIIGTSSDVSSDASRNARTGSAFDLLLNPFVLLGIAVSATAQEIKRAHDDAVEDGVAPADVLQRAQQTLLTPKLRVEAEIGGFLDVSPQLSNRVIAKLKAGAGRSEFEGLFGSLHALPRSSVLAHLGAQFPLAAGELFELLEAQATISAGSIYEAIVEAREEAGFGKVDLETITAALEQLKERQIKAVVNTLICETAFAATFSAFVKRVLAAGDPSLVTNLDKYISVYGHAAAPELSRRREAVVTACDALRSDTNNETAINSIERTLREWNEIGNPLQLFESHMHREDALARDLYLHVRDLCLWLANEKNLYLTAQKITRACADVFKDLPRAIEQIKGESALLAKLHSEKTAVTLLEPLSQACEEAQQNHRGLERALLHKGFGPASRGTAKTLYEKFVHAIGVTKATEVSDLPWRLVREVAISLNNDSKSPWAAAAIINGLVDFFSFQRPSAEIVQMLERDQQASRKVIIETKLEGSLSAGHLAEAETLVGQLLALEQDEEKIAAIKVLQATISQRRRARNIKIGLWVAAGAVVLTFIVANQDNRPSYTPPPPAPRSSPSQQTTIDVNEVRPPVGTGLNASRANIRYCQFQDVRLEALRPLIVSQSDVAVFNGLVNDWNSRCARYRYSQSDMSAVQAEVRARRATLEAEGRAIANTWRTR
jgi:tetratricopeptide (TPR) repeat protein